MSSYYRWVPDHVHFWLAQEENSSSQPALLSASPVNILYYTPPPVGDTNNQRSSENLSPSKANKNALMGAVVLKPSPNSAGSTNLISIFKGF